MKYCQISKLNIGVEKNGMIFFLGNFIYTYFFVVRNKHYYPASTIGSFFGGKQGWRGKLASVQCSLQVPY